jgi:hypothetical protein
MNIARIRPRLSPVLFAACVFVGCVGTTGSEVVSFRASAAGPADATGGPYSFVSGRGYDVTLSRARLTIGAIYLNRSVPISGGQERSCIQPGIYVGEVLRGGTVDLLSPTPVAMAELGHGTRDRAASAEVWLFGGNIDAPDDRTVVLDVEGTATREGAPINFFGRVTIGKNRQQPPTDPARPGASPLCKDRIAGPVSVDLTPTEGGELLVRINPRGLFANVEFTDLTPGPSPSDPRRFTDSNDDAPSFNLFRGLLAQSGTFSFEWKDMEK